MGDFAVKVENVSKDFSLVSTRATTLKSLLTGFHKDGSRQSGKIQHALIDIDFEVKKGEFFGIVGRNGSGKSTLLKIIAGIYQPAKGRVYVNGKLVPFIELGVGFNPELTGRENVYMNGAMLGFSVKQVDAFYKEVVEFAELEEFMEKKLKNYSSGMQVRLAFSMAIRANADVLLVDEVLAVGDADFQRKCFRYFKSLKQQKKTVIFVTHDMNAVREYCDKAILIEKQKIVLSGDAEKVAQRYEKLLQPKAEGQKTGDNDKIWGDETLSIKKPSVEHDEETIRVSYTLVANKECTDCVAGFSVKKMDGQVLFGTNSMIEKVKLPALKVGKKINVSWSIPKILPEGDYSVALAAQYDGGNTTGMWWEDAATFSVISDKRTPYIVQPPYEFTYKEV